MSEFTILVITVAVIDFFLSWLALWMQFEQVSTALGIISAVAILLLVIMGLDEIIHYVAMSLGF